MIDDLISSYRNGWFFPIHRPEGGRFARWAARRAIAAQEATTGIALWLGQIDRQPVRIITSREPRL
jgi:hypothetical protein